MSIATRTEADQVIITCIEAGGGAGGDDYYLDQIADDLYDEVGTWDVEQVPTETFWAIVQRWDRALVKDAAHALLNNIAERTNSEWKGSVLEITAPDGSILAIAFDDLAGSEGPGYSYGEYRSREDLAQREEITSGGGEDYRDMDSEVDAWLTKHTRVEH